MLRMYLLQLWFNLSDEGAEDTICDSYAMRKFMGLNFWEKSVPDATTLLKFRHLLETHELGKKLFEEQNKILEEYGYILRGGTIVDATIISTPKSTKNKERARDPEGTPQRRTIPATLHTSPPPDQPMSRPANVQRYKSEGTGLCESSARFLVGPLRFVFRGDSSSSVPKGNPAMKGIMADIPGHHPLVPNIAHVSLSLHQVLTTHLIWVEVRQ